MDGRLMVDPRTELVYADSSRGLPMRLRLRFPSQRAYVTLVSTAARILLNSLPTGSWLFARLEQPLAEATEHAILDANGERAELPVEVEIRIDAPDVVVSIADHGAQPGTPHRGGSTTGSGADPGHRLDLIRSMSDGFAVERLSSGGRLTMTWRIPTEPTAPTP